MYELNSPRPAGLPLILVWLVGIMIGLQVLMSFGPTSIQITLRDFGAFSTDFSSVNFADMLIRLPSLITYALLHGGWVHLIFNCMLLVHLGRGIATSMKTVNFLIFFALCAVGGAIFHLCLTGHESFLVGASASVFGVAAARGIALSRLISGFGARRKYLLQYSVGWMLLNLATVLFVGLSSGAANPFVTAVAWQAHLGGYLVGLATAGRLMKE